MMFIYIVIPPGCQNRIRHRIQAAVRYIRAVAAPSMEEAAESFKSREEVLPQYNRIIERGNQ